MSIIDEVYEARYGWTRRTVLVTAFAVLATVAGLLAPGFSMPLRIAAVLLFGFGGGLMAYGAAGRKVALRVDGTGILLGGSPVRYAQTTVFVPWHEVAAVELWTQRLRGGHGVPLHLPYVGVHRIGGAPAGAVARAVSGTLTPVSAELVANSRAVNGWPFDTKAFTDAVARHAPQLQIRVAANFPAKR
ncbi:hypothetical protein [Kitasatospora sp. LaBMicrA B282]|uniref:hypothetical protein n=1 Tax=Kitasatospora sp. LaBMicrA B282 TaxID=3420949 RepID=UPI003D11F17D